MYIYKIGYRHANGEVEGFVGVGSTMKASKVNAFRAVRVGVSRKLLPFDPKGIIESVVHSEKKLTDEEMVTLQEDWKNY